MIIIIFIYFEVPHTMPNATYDVCSTMRRLTHIRVRIDSCMDFITSFDAYYSYIWIWLRTKIQGMDIFQEFFLILVFPSLGLF